MTQPAGPIIGAAHLDDGINTRFRWNEESGLASPASRAVGSIQQTFGGPVRVVPTPVTYPTKDLDLPGYLLQVNGLAEGYDRLDRLYNLAGTAGTVSILQMGALGLEVIPETPIVERLKAHRVQLDFSMKGTAIPATWTALFGSYLGAAYGMVANGESLINTSAFALASGASPTVTNAGSAPTPIVLTISVSGPRTTRFYVRCTAPGYTKRISVTPVSGGVVSIGEKDGLFVPPGASVLRYEEANGTLITGTIASSIYGTRWRYEGLDESLSEVGPVVVYNTRQQRGYAATGGFTSGSGLTLYGPDVPRFGSSGTFNANTAGLVVEPDRTNLVLQSQALGTAPWATLGTITVTNNAVLAPDGSTTGTRLQFTAGASGLVGQSVTLTAAPYVVSFYARSATSDTFTVSMGAILTSQVINTTDAWQRYQYLVTGTAAAYSLNFSDNALAAANVSVWGVQVELATGQTAANATSYIPTTTTTQRRYGDILGVRPVENLLAWSNRFDKQTASSTTQGLWYLSGATVTTSPRQNGPSGVVDATQIAFSAGQYVWQSVLNCENLRGKTVVLSVWVRNASATPDNDFSLTLSEVYTSGSGSTSHSVTALDDQWRRISVQRRLDNQTLTLRAQLQAPAGGITVYVAHAHLYVASEGTYNLVSAAAASVSAPYIETQANPVYRAKGWEWPDWLTQNGYIEADVCLSETANPNLSTRMIVGLGSTEYAPNANIATIFRSASTGSASNEIRYARTDNLAGWTTSYTPSSSVFDSVYRTYRLEWVNYTIAGTRTMEARLYINGTIVSTTSRPSSSSWVKASGLDLIGGVFPCFQTMKNIKIGSPVLPANAVPAPY